MAALRQENSPEVSTLELFLAPACRSCLCSFRSPQAFSGPSDFFRSARGGRQFVLGPFRDPRELESRSSIRRRFSCRIFSGRDRPFVEPIAPLVDRRDQSGSRQVASVLSRLLGKQPTRPSRCRRRPSPKT